MGVGRKRKQPLTEKVAKLRIQMRLLLCDDCNSVIKALDPAIVPLDEPELEEFGGDKCLRCLPLEP